MKQRLKIFSVRSVRSCVVPRDEGRVSRGRELRDLLASFFAPAFSLDTRPSIVTVTFSQEATEETEI
jgi:hypothetical protein